MVTEVRQILITPFKVVRVGISPITVVLKTQFDNSGAQRHESALRPRIVKTLKKILMEEEMDFTGSNLPLRIIGDGS